MPGWMIGLIVIVLIILFVIMWVISVQGKLVNFDELTQNALSQVGVQQNSRWDALTQVANLTREYSKHEVETLEKIISKRQPVVRGTSVEVANEQENLLTQAMTHIMAVAEAYPDLKANTLYSQTISDIKEYEQNVRMSRMVYNDTVTKYNRVVRTLPDSIISSMLGFSTKSYLKTPDEKKDMPNLTK